MSPAGALFGSGLAGWAIDALLASALLMAAVLLVRGAVRRAFGAQVAYALWGLPVLRLLLPPLPAGWWKAAEVAPIRQASETVTIYLIEPVAAAAAAGTAPSLAFIAALIWGAGAALFLVWHIIRHQLFCRAVLRDAAMIEQRDGIRVVASASAPGPLAFGIRQRFVAFPRDFAERYDADERALALAHELGHHRRRDLLANWVALVVLALHWFSPLAWFAFRAFRADQEMANDAAVLADCAPAARHAYGRAIVKAAAPGLGLSAACHLHTVADLKGRLKMLTTSRVSRRRLATGAAAVTLLAAGGLGVTASSSAAETLRATLEEAPPAPPAAPVPPPRAPQAAPVAPNAPTPPAAAASSRQVKRVIVVRDGETRTYEGADADRYIAENDLPIPPVPPLPPVVRAPGAPPAPGGLSVMRPRVMVMRTTGAGPQGEWQVDVPEVLQQRCAGDAARPMVENRTENGRQRVIICTNRIDAMQRGAQSRVMVMPRVDMAHMAMGNARAGLAMARRAIEGDRTLTAQQRTQALAGIAQAERELRDPANN